MQRGPIIHLEFDSKEAVNGALVRLQEFYESPLPGIRGNFFTHAEYARVNAAANDGVYVYDWDGFNIPGCTVREFFARFHVLSGPELAIKEVIDSLGTADFYLIATHDEDEDRDTVAHELCHALWYLDTDYFGGAFGLVMNFTAAHPDLELALRKWLLARGYDKSVLSDEMNAYLATTPKEWWSEPDQGMDPALAACLWTAGAPFREFIGRE